VTRVRKGNVHRKFILFLTILSLKQNLLHYVESDKIFQYRGLLKIRTPFHKYLNVLVRNFWNSLDNRYSSDYFFLSYPLRDGPRVLLTRKKEYNYSIFKALTFLGR